LNLNLFIYWLITVTSTNIHITHF